MRHKSEQNTWPITKLHRFFTYDKKNHHTLRNRPAPSIRVGGAPTALRSLVAKTALVTGVRDGSDIGVKQKIQDILTRKRNCSLWGDRHVKNFGFFYVDGVTWRLLCLIFSGRIEKCLRVLSDLFRALPYPFVQYPNPLDISLPLQTLVLGCICLFHHIPNTQHTGFNHLSGQAHPLVS